MPLDELITWIESKGAKIRRLYDPAALISEGRYELREIRITGLRNIWPLPLDLEEAAQYITHLQAIEWRFEPCP